MNQQRRDQRCTAARPPAAAADESPPPGATRVPKAVGWGVLGMIGVAVAYGVLWGVIDVHLGLLAIAVLGGWLIGAAVRQGAWAGQPHARDTRPAVIAAVMGVMAWLGGAFVAYLLSQALIPASALTLPERLAETPFGNYIAGVFGIVQVAAVVIMALVAWRTAR